MKKSLLALAIAASAFSAQSFAVGLYPEFTIDKDMIAGGATYEGDKFTGTYSEVVTFGLGSFATAISMEVGGLTKNDGANNVIGTGINNDYGMYALFNGTGTFSTSVAGITTFTFLTGSMSLYRDNALDTIGGGLTAPATGLGSFTASGTAGTDDILLATGTLDTGKGKLDPSLCNASGINCGSFGTDISFNLTADGMKYFVAPAPFYNLSFEAGQLNNFVVAGTQTIDGSMDITFGTKIPEPSTLALLGLGLSGLGLSLRRKAA